MDLSEKMRFSGRAETNVLFKSVRMKEMPPDVAGLKVIVTGCPERIPIPESVNGFAIVKLIYYLEEIAASIDSRMNLGVDFAGIKSDRSAYFS